uniref:NADH-ubiquinone oxidoreductase chain 5 n=1 Tax=Cassida sp. EMHAU-15090501 TaxID=2480058 RepID=A0A3G3C767_9CUCU|nr:NADH dehydrogenase subunit 5 [Cassida sp. EMHAU-15090501]
MCLKYSSLLIMMFFSMFFIGLYFMLFDYSFLLEFPILSINSSMISFILLFDWISVIFSSFVMLICSSVLIYSEEYMKLDKSLSRFVYLVMLFLFSMIIMIFSPNLISILLGWDGLGLVSYCLVIYYQNTKSVNAGLLTILSNRVGDVFLMMSIVWMLNFGSWNCFYYFDFVKSDFSMYLVVTLVVFAGITKSAQIPFSAWLPAAMAAPTPVSSLVHSSTLVTAGVYLMIRFYDGFSDSILMFMLYISVLTMFLAGLVACFEFDLKKIIAMSTLSQLGLMMSILFMGDMNLAFFHLLVHALFKALLFMCAGFIIHSSLNCQDIRFMGSMIKVMPVTFSYFIICNFSLCGLPFLSGFYSKDLVVEFMMMGYMNIFIFVIYMISLGLTVLYTIRLILYLVSKNFNNFSLHSVNETWDYMLIGMSILIFFVVFSGSMMMWLMFNPYFICLPFSMKMLTFFVIFLSYLFSLNLHMFNYFYYSKYLYFNKLGLFVGSIFYMSFISTHSFSNLFKISRSLNNKFDQGWFEYYGSKGLFKNLYILSKFFQVLSLNHFKFFFIVLMFWFMLVLFILYLYSL